MPKRSAGIVLHRRGTNGTEVLLVHPGGPFWRNKQVGVWQIPKGEIGAGEDPEQAARREVREEIGFAVEGEMAYLGEVRQAGGKQVLAFAKEADLDPGRIVSNTVEITWPPRSGHWIAVPEVDEARWLGMEEARRLMLPSQRPLLDALETMLGREPPA